MYVLCEIEGLCVRLKVCVWDWRSVHVYWRSLCVNWRSVCVNWSSVCVNWKSLDTQSLLCWAKVFNTWCQGYRGGTSTTVGIIRKNNRLSFCVPTYVSIIQFGHLSGIRLTTTVTCDNYLLWNAKYENCVLRPVHHLYTATPTKRTLSCGLDEWCNMLHIWWCIQWFIV